MPQAEKSRKTLFLAAIRLAETTVERFASTVPNSAGGIGVSTVTLYEVLNGKTTSAAITAAVDALIREQFSAVRKQLTTVAA